MSKHDKPLDMNARRETLAPGDEVIITVGGIDVHVWHDNALGAAKVMLTTAGENDVALSWCSSTFEHAESIRLQAQRIARMRERLMMRCPICLAEPGTGCAETRSPLDDSRLHPARGQV